MTHIWELAVVREVSVAKTLAYQLMKISPSQPLLISSAIGKRLANYRLEPFEEYRDR